MIDYQNFVYCVYFLIGWLLTSVIITKNRCKHKFVYFDKIEKRRCRLGERLIYTVYVSRCSECGKISYKEI